MGSYLNSLSLDQQKVHWAIINTMSPSEQEAYLQLIEEQGAEKLQHDTQNIHLSQEKHNARQHRLRLFKAAKEIDQTRQNSPALQFSASNYNSRTQLTSFSGQLNDYRQNDPLKNTLRDKWINNRHSEKTEQQFDTQQSLSQTDDTPHRPISTTLWESPDVELVSPTTSEHTISVPTNRKSMQSQHSQSTLLNSPTDTKKYESSNESMNPAPKHSKTKKAFEKSNTTTDLYKSNNSSQKRQSKSRFSGIFKMVSTIKA